MKKIIIVLILIFLGYVSKSQSVIPERVGEEIYKTYSSPHPYSRYSKEKGEKVWEQTFFEEGASYIAVHFSKIEIAQEDYLVIRDPANTRSWKYTYEEILQKGNRFWSIHIYG